MRQATLAKLFEDARDKLKLEWLSGDLELTAMVGHDGIPPTDMVGYLNLIHPYRIHILGAREVEWSQAQSPEKIDHFLREIFSAKPPAVIVADGAETPEAVHAYSRRMGTPLLASPYPAAFVVDFLRSYLARQVAQMVTLHGVMMDVLGMGVLITGDSGAGKSELALELISRNHGLVADDMVEIYRIATNTLEARCPDVLRDFLEVRGLGVLNIRTIFGETSCRRKMKLKLIVHLQKVQPGAVMPDRLPMGTETQEVLEVPVRRIVLPVAAGRNLGVLLEAAVRSTILQLRGIDSTQEFIERQRQFIDSTQPMGYTDDTDEASAFLPPIHPNQE